MFSHVMIGANDLPRMVAFYDAVLLPIGLAQRQTVEDGGPMGACWVRPGEKMPRFYVQGPFNRKPARPGNGVMMAFSAPDRAAVDHAYAAGLAAGGTDDGAPGLRPHYGNGYYGCYLHDPEGNKLHVVYRGDLI